MRPELHSQLVVSAVVEVERDRGTGANRGEGEPIVSSVAGRVYHDRRMDRFHTQSEARQFFVDRIIDQARTDGVALSDDEKQMLSWSEVEPESVADLALAERLSTAIADADYESKIAGLLSRSFDSDVAADAGRKQLWSDAMSVLNRGDHYLLVMINQSIERKLKPWWRFW